MQPEVKPFARPVSLGQAVDAYLHAHAVIWADWDEAGGKGSVSGSDTPGA